MKLRNLTVVRKTGIKLLAGLLAIGMTFGSPLSVLADEIPIEEGSPVNEDGKERLQARKVEKCDGSDEFVDVSDEVLELIQNGEVKLNEETGYLEDVADGRKVNPETGERVDENVPTDPTKPVDPNPGTTDPKPSEPENPPTPEDPTKPSNPEKPSDSGKDDSDKDMTSGEKDASKSDNAKSEEESGKDTNDSLISRQQIVKLPEIVEDFRFWTVARKYGFAKLKEVSVLEEIPTDNNANIRTVGTIPKKGLFYVLKQVDKDWLYIESGNVRGFVKKSDVYTGTNAQKVLKIYQKRAKRAAKEAGEKYTGIEIVAPTAKETVAPTENKAFTYLRATVNSTVVKKDYALVNDQVGENVLNIRESQNQDAKVIGTLNQGDLCYVLKKVDDNWSYIESGDVRGFVENKYLAQDEKTKEAVTKTGEDNYETAKEIVKPEENKALYYTLTSIKTGTPSGEVRNAILEYASQFVGNPYAWGGTSLTDGADCSGFVQQIYKAFGYDLPRVAEAQSQYGTQIAVEDAEPGDLIFYAKKGHVYHVAIYAGDGKTLEAANEDQGIIQGTVNTADAVWATRVVKDETTLAGGGIAEVNATEDMYGLCLGDFKITYYCACEICCDKETGITATGTPVIEGQTIAVDPSIIPYGSKVIIGGHVFTAEDCGGAIKDKRIDIYVNSHEEALALGTTNATVYLVK